VNSTYIRLHGAMIKKLKICLHFIPLPPIGKSQNETVNAVSILIGLGMRNCSGKISVLLKWKVFYLSLELEMGKL